MSRLLSVNACRVFNNFRVSSASFSRRFSSTNLLENELKVEIYPSPFLKSHSQPVVEFDEPFREFTQKLTQLMKRERAEGIAAPQVGVNLDVVVINTESSTQIKSDALVLVNPRVKKASKATVSLDEGCISFPNLYCNIERPREVVVEAQDVEGKLGTYRFGGRIARAFQHEFDHLQGVSFPELAKPEEWTTVAPKLEALEKAYHEQHPYTHMECCPSPSNESKEEAKI